MDGVKIQSIYDRLLNTNQTDACLKTLYRHTAKHVSAQQTELLAPTVTVPTTFFSCGTTTRLTTFRVTFLVITLPSSSVYCSSVTDSPGMFLTSSP